MGADHTDFYVASATLIPVYFVAFAVLVGADRIRTADEDATTKEPPQLGAGLLVLSVCAFAVLMGAGEIAALFALLYDSTLPRECLTILADCAAICSGPTAMANSLAKQFGMSDRQRRQVTVIVGIVFIGLVALAEFA